jgi:hypothetical protein
MLLDQINAGRASRRSRPRHISISQIRKSAINRFIPIDEPVLKAGDLAGSYQRLSTRYEDHQS